MLISAFDVVFLSSWESICPSQLSFIQRFGGGVGPSSLNIDGFFSAVGVCLHFQIVVFVVSSALWHDGEIYSHLDGFLKPPWPTPLKSMSVRGSFTEFLFSSMRRLCLVPLWCVGSGLCKLVRIMKFVFIGSHIWVESFGLFRDYMMLLWSMSATRSRLRWQIIFVTLILLLLQWFTGQIHMYSTCYTITQGTHLSGQRKEGDDSLWIAMISEYAHYGNTYKENELVDEVQRVKMKFRGVFFFDLSSAFSQFTLWHQGSTRGSFLVYQGSLLLLYEDFMTRDSSGCRVNKAVFMKNVLLMDHIGVTKRSMIVNRTLIRTNWYQIVTLSGLVLDAMGFTSTIKKPPQNKERLRYHIGAKWYLKKYYKYVYSLASKAFLTRTRREYYFFISFQHMAHISACVIIYVL